MQSLQMRWPVAAQSGLSMHTVASAPSAQPSVLRSCISETFSSSGQPASSTPNTVLPKAPVRRSRSPRAQLSLPWLWQKMQ